MKFLKDWFLPTEEKSESQGSVIDRIAADLQGVEEKDKAYLAAFAFILGRVAYADQNFSDEEKSTIRELLYEKSDLTEAQAGAVVDIVAHLSEWKGATENYLVTRYFCENATAEQKSELMECLFLVSAADESISSSEEKELKLIATEIQFSEAEFFNLRSRYREHREVLKGMPSKG